jgi:hypothetical protein
MVWFALQHLIGPIHNSSLSRFMSDVRHFISTHAVPTVSFFENASMQFSRLLFYFAVGLLPFCLISTTWMYLYPLFHGCGFPVPDSDVSRSARAPFRLLALGDPQLEGDSSLPQAGARVFPALQYLSEDVRGAGTWHQRREIVQGAVKEAATRDLPKWLESVRKRTDLWGNDLYLAHIVRQLRWYTQPTHIAVLGDLLGSQWISDEEFARRAGRYWDTVFRGMEPVPDAVMETNEEEGRKWGGTVEVLREHDEWETRVINIAGNHDIGYAGDLTQKRMDRFEKTFGRANWDVVFKLPGMNATGREQEGEIPALRLVILNSMNLDTPAFEGGLQRETYDFMNHIITTSRPVTDKTHATILLTHIPLHKESGICVDDPFFDYFDTGSGVKEQNMLSSHASKTVLEGIFGLSGNKHADGKGLGRRGIIINGHDHEGCDVLHYMSRNPNLCSPATFDVGLSDDMYLTSDNITEHPEWRAFRLPSSPSSPAHPNPALQLNDCVPDEEVPMIRELTLRSMMGDFEGYAGFLSAWFDETLGEKGEWRLNFTTCGVGVQHWWWVVHVVDFIFLVALTGGLLAWGVEKLWEAGLKSPRATTKEKKVLQVSTLEAKTRRDGMADRKDAKSPNDSVKKTHPES